MHKEYEEHWSQKTLEPIDLHCVQSALRHLYGLFCVQQKKEFSIFGKLPF